jgi:hypothetical protein
LGSLELLIMATDNTTPPADEQPSPPDDAPTTDDADFAEGLLQEVVRDDDFQLPDSSRRSLNGDTVFSADVTDEFSISPGAPAAVTCDKLETSDVGTLTDESVPTVEVPLGTEPPDWDYETTSHRIVIELKRIESEVREILEGRDSKRKRKLGGSRRWLEFEEDIIAWRYTGRFDEPTLRHLQELVVKRHYLFRRLRFIAGTRQTWNT